MGKINEPAPPSDRREAIMIDRMKTELKNLPDCRKAEKILHFIEGKDVSGDDSVVELTRKIVQRIAETDIDWLMQRVLLWKVARIIKELYPELWVEYVAHKGKGIVIADSVWKCKFEPNPVAPVMWAIEILHEHAYMQSEFGFGKQLQVYTDGIHLESGFAMSQEDKMLKYGAWISLTYYHSRKQILSLDDQSYTPIYIPMWARRFEDLFELPKWNYYGSSTREASGDDNEVILLYGAEQDTLLQTNVKWPSGWPVGGWPVGGYPGHQVPEHIMVDIGIIYGRRFKEEKENRHSHPPNHVEIMIDDNGVVKVDKGKTKSLNTFLKFYGNRLFQSYCTHENRLTIWAALYGMQWAQLSVLGNPLDKLSEARGSDTMELSMGKACSITVWTSIFFLNFIFAAILTLSLPYRMPAYLMLGFSLLYYILVIIVAMSGYSVSLGGSAKMPGLLFALGGATGLILLLSIIITGLLYAAWYSSPNEIDGEPTEKTLA